MPSTYTVFPEYDYHALCLYIAKVSGSDIKSVVTKPQLNYLDAYLKSPEMDVKSVLCEYEYVEKFYLSDYAEYFVRCFADYKRKASRIHFFSCKLTEQSFDNLLSGEAEDQEAEIKLLQQHYLGYMVVRPIPATFIAKTCVRPYKSLLTDRASTAVLSRSNMVNLFGIHLAVDALPYQEQDRVVAICATAALWSFFNAPIFQLERIPSPSEITKQASLAPDNANRTFPSGGLSHQMLVSSITDKGLDPVSYGFKETYLVTKQYFKEMRKKSPEAYDGVSEGMENAICVDAAFSLMKELVYAYVSCGFPVILGTHTFELVEESEPSRYRCVGRHAVTISGFNFSEFYTNRPTLNEADICEEANIDGFNESLNLRAHKITEFYVHNDQLGPYAAAKIVSKSFEVVEGRDGCGTDKGYQGQQCRHLDMSLWDTETAVGRNQTHIPSELLMGVNPKIRIGYKRIKDTCIGINKYTVAGWGELLLHLEENGKSNPELEATKSYGADYSKIEWDIRLLTVNKFKEKLLKRSVVGRRESYLASSWPKHVWVATGRYLGNGDDLLFDYVFDATDIDQGSVYLDTIYYSSKYLDFSTQVLSHVFRWLTNKSVRDNDLYDEDSNLLQVALRLTEDPQQLNDELALRFGVPHPASHIKEFEVVNNGLMRQRNVQVLKFGLKPRDKIPLKSGVPYIWAVCEQGYLHLGRDIPVDDTDPGKGNIGHPTLTANMWARIAGELRYEKQQNGKSHWVINNSSGRFCKPYVGVEEEHLDNVKELFSVYYPEHKEVFQTKFFCNND